MVGFTEDVKSFFEAANRIVLITIVSFVLENLPYAEVEKVSESGNVVPINFFGFKFSQKVFKKILRLDKNF